MVSETDAGLVERLTIDDAIRFMETACRNWENFAINHDDADDMRVALEAFRKQYITEAAARITELKAEVERKDAALSDLRKAVRDLDCPDILGTAEACASGLPKWDHVSRKINAARDLLKE